MSNREADKRAIMAQLPKGSSILMTVNASKAYDAGYANGQKDAKQEAYNKGFSDANHYASKVMIACSCLALSEVFGFGEQRMQRFAEAFRSKLIDVLDGNDAIRECTERFGITLTDELFDEDDEDENA